VLLVLSLIGCLAGTYLGEPESVDILKHFYRTTRPWGFWRPIRELVVSEDPAFQPNNDFLKDSINVIVGIVWQVCLTALPIFLVLREWQWVSYALATLVVTTIFIKFNWYDKLPSAAAESSLAT
jgi:SSS family solute:Na+ symporter